MPESHKTAEENLPDTGDALLKEVHNVDVSVGELFLLYSQEFEVFDLALGTLTINFHIVALFNEPAFAKHLTDKRQSARSNKTFI